MKSILFTKINFSYPFHSFLILRIFLLRSNRAYKIRKLFINNFPLFVSERKRACQRLFSIQGIRISRILASNLSTVGKSPTCHLEKCSRAWDTNRRKRRVTMVEVEGGGRFLSRASDRANLTADIIVRSRIPPPTPPWRVAVDGDGGGRVGRRSRKSLNLDCASEMTLAPPRKTSFRRLEHCLKAAKKRRGEERRWKGGGRESERDGSGEEGWRR